MSDDEKIKSIENKFRDIMEILGLDLTDDSLSGTPLRVAKMYVKEAFAGLNPKKQTGIKAFLKQVRVQRDAYRKKYSSPFSL